MYSFPITIDKTKVSGSLTNYTYFFSENASSIPSGFWSHVTDTVTGLDIRFYDTDGLTELSREIVLYNNSTHKVEAWVQTPTLNSFANKVIICKYGDATRANDTSVWSDINCQADYHIQTDLSDSSGNAHTGISQDQFGQPNLRISPTKIHNGFENPLQSPQYYPYIPGNIPFQPPCTMLAWVYRYNNSYVNPRYGDTILAKRTNSSNIEFDWYQGIIGVDKQYVVIANNSQGYQSNTTLPVGSWCRVAVKLEVVTSVLTLTFYKDGQPDGVRTVPTPPPALNTFTEIGSHWKTVNNSYGVEGMMDEIQIFSDAKSDAWIATEYANQNDPATFSSAGAESGGSVEYDVTGDILTKGSAFSSSVNISRNVIGGIASDGSPASSILLPSEFSETCVKTFYVHVHSVPVRVIPNRPVDTSYWTRRNFWKFGQGDWADPPDTRDRHLQIVGLGDGVNTSFSGQTKEIPVPSHVTFAYLFGGVAQLAVDDGSGTVREGAIFVGTVDYSTGIFNLTFTHRPDTGSCVYVNISDIEAREILSTEPVYSVAKLPEYDPNGRGVIRYILFLMQKVFLDGSSEFTDVHGKTINAMQSLRDEVKKLATLIDPDETPVGFLPYLARNLGYEFIFANSILSPPIALAKAWSVSEIYTAQTVVLYNGYTYVSIQNGNQGNIPGSSPLQWSLFAALSSEKARRNEIKWATRWYALKGVVSGFEILFDAIGRPIKVKYVWTNKNDFTDHVAVPYGEIPSENSGTPDSWVYFPDSIIRVQPDLSYFVGLIPEAFNDIVARLEEVIPAHLKYEIVAVLDYTGEDGGISSGGDAFPISDDSHFYLHVWADLNGQKQSPFLDRFPWEPENCLTHGSRCFPPPKHDGYAITAHDGEWDNYADAPFTHMYYPGFPQRGWCEFHDNPLDVPLWVDLHTYKGDDFSTGVIDSGWDSQFTSKYSLKQLPPMSLDYCAYLTNHYDSVYWWRVFSGIEGSVQLDFSIKMTDIQQTSTDDILALRLVQPSGGTSDGVVVGIVFYTYTGYVYFIRTPSSFLTVPFVWSAYKEVQFRIVHTGDTLTGYYNDGMGWFLFPTSFDISGVLNIDSVQDDTFSSSQLAYGKFEFQADSGFPNAGSNNIIHNNDCQTDKLWIYNHSNHSVPLYESSGYPY